MEKLLGILTNENLSISTVIIVIIITIIFNLKNIIELIDSRKKIKISKLEEALKNTSIKGLDRELLENELIKEHFKTTLGLNIEKEFREAIIKVHQGMKGKIAFKHFQRALPLLNYEEEKVIVKISKFNLFAYYYNLYAGIIFIVLSFISFVQVIYNHSESMFILLSSFALGIFLLSVGFMVIFSTREVRSAKLISKELNTKRTDKTQ